MKSDMPDDDLGSLLVTIGVALFVVVFLVMVASLFADASYVEDHQPKPAVTSPEKV